MFSRKIMLIVINFDQVLLYALRIKVNKNKKCSMLLSVDRSEFLFESNDQLSSDRKIPN